MLDEDFDRLSWVAEHVAFPEQWAVLERNWGLKVNHEAEKDRVQYRKRHISFQLLSLIWTLNAKLLSWWAMIQSVANFGLGVGATASDINSY